MCVCVRSFLPFTFSFWHKFWVSHFSWAPRGVSQRGWRYYHCVFYQETFSEKISTAGKWWPLLEALLIPCSPKKNSVPLLNMHLCYLLPTWAEFMKKKRSQQGQDQRAGKSGHILRVTAACQAWGGGDALCGTWGLWVGVLLGLACPRGVVGAEGPQVVAGGVGWWGGGLAVPLRGVHHSGWVQRSGHQPLGVGGKPRPSRAGPSAECPSGPMFPESHAALWSCVGCLHAVQPGSQRHFTDCGSWAFKTKLSLNCVVP